MSRLPDVVGHADVRAALGGAISRGELPGSILLHGPVGIGKQRLALWTAQRLLCDSPLGAEPCGKCRPCVLASRLEHPDLHWFFPLTRPKASGPDRLADALEEARATELADRRERPFRPTLPGELTGIYLAQVQTIRRMAIARPAMGSRKVFVIGDAEQLVPQEASTEAANALLKVLEEPPPHTIFILTSNDPDELLPTIKSRLLPVRVRPLSEDLVADTLQTHLNVEPRLASLVAHLSEGSIGRALAFLPDDGEPGPLEVLRTHARELLEAAVAKTPVDRLAAALATSPAGARGAFADTLDFLAFWIRDLAAIADGAPEMVVNVDSRERLERLITHLNSAASGAPDALRSIDIARGMTRSNINPQLTLAWLLKDIGQALARPR